MSNRPLVSSIIIFLNAEKFIQEAIESVFAQTHDRWELLLVDDGSTDGSTAIALEYAQQYPEKVRYLEHEGHQNRGMSAARNLGICHANGKYIAFLDADDVWLPLKLEQQVAILDSQPEAAMLYGRTQYWLSWTGNPEDIQRDSLTELGIQPNTLVKPPTLLILFLQNCEIYPCTCSVLVRREVFEDVGGFEEDFRDANEDMVFHSKVFLKAPVFVSGECWDRYRQHPDSYWAIARKKGLYQNPSQPYPAGRVYLNWLVEYLSKQGIKDAEVWKALQKALWPYRHPVLYRLLGLPRNFMKQTKELVIQIGRQTLPASLRSWLWIQWQDRKFCPPVGWVRFGSLRRFTPISRAFGFDRGQPIDRYYIEQFLSAHALDIQGRVLEIADNSYTYQFGGDRVTESDVLNLVKDDPKVTIVADLTAADHVPSDSFDCIILTQTLHLIYDVRAALRNLYRILKPGGVLLATFPGISQISNFDWGDRGCWYWNFTTLSARRLVEETCPTAQVQIKAHGNVLVAISFLHGLATQELRQAELDHHDPDYEVLITLRVVKPEVTL